jgi:hypothetical protein
MQDIQIHAIICPNCKTKFILPSDFKVHSMLFCSECNYEWLVIDYNELEHYNKKFDISNNNFIIHDEKNTTAKQPKKILLFLSIILIICTLFTFYYDECYILYVHFYNFVLNQQINNTTFVVVSYDHAYLKILVKKTTIFKEAKIITDKEIININDRKLLTKNETFNINLNFKNPHFKHLKCYINNELIYSIIINN